MDEGRKHSALGGKIVSILNCLSWRTGFCFGVVLLGGGEFSAERQIFPKINEERMESAATCQEPGKPQERWRAGSRAHHTLQHPPSRALWME